MRLRCANCQLVFRPEDAKLTSRLYGTHGVVDLCVKCRQYEEDRIKEVGTNSIPELLTLYVSATGSSLVTQ